MATAESRPLWSRLAGVAWRALIPAIAVSATVLGYLGMGELLAGQNEFAADIWDRLYYTLQLFVLGAPPLDSGGTLPVALQIARFLAPAVTVYALVETTRILFAAELTRMRARRSRGHAIVCGDSLVADALATRLSENGRRVVRVLSPDKQTGGRRSLMLVPADLDHAEAFRGIGLARADSLYVCFDDTARNLEVVLRVAGRRRRSRLHVEVQVDDPELCLALQARRLGLRGGDDRLIVNFFNWHERAAHGLLEGRQPPVHPDRPTGVMVVGASWFARALIVELARTWRLRGGGRRLNVVLVDADATDAVLRLRRLYPFINEVCRFATRNRDAGDLLDGDLPDAPPDRVYICCDDEEVGLKLALTMDHFWRGGPRSVVVRLGRLGGLTQVFDGPGERLLDPVAGTLDMFDALRAATGGSLTEDSLTERLARAIHDRYLLRSVERGRTLGSTPAMADWSALPESLRDSNRAQAADIGPKLADVGCALAPQPVWGEPVSLTAAMVERLARREHRRWCAVALAQGWRYGPARDEGERLHPDLVDWDHLTESARDKDRDTVRQLPELLADAGFRIVRVREIGDPSRDPLTPLPTSL